MNAGIGLLQTMNQQRAQDLEREKFEFQKTMAPWALAVGVFGDTMKSISWGGTGGKKGTPG